MVSRGNAQRPYVPPPVGEPSPGLAALLGFIPGVGAMYNGQFVKGMVHVVIFAVLVSAAHVFGVFGLFIAAWIFYQVFEAYQTAKARRDGDPLPDPLGLNELSNSILGSMRPPQGPPPGAGTGAAGVNPAVDQPASQSSYAIVQPGAVPGPLPTNVWDSVWRSGRSSDPANSAGASYALAAQGAGWRHNSDRPGCVVSAGAVRLVFVALVPL